MSKKMMILLFAVIICLSLAGCSLQDKIGDYSREQCYLNKENVTQFSYKGNDYTILADTVSNSGLGEWIGYIRQLAAVDESGKILLQENLKTATFQTLADLADLVDKAPNDAYIIPFLNVYAAPNADDYLIVDSSCNMPPWMRGRMALRSSRTRAAPTRQPCNPGASSHRSFRVPPLLSGVSPCTRAAFWRGRSSRLASPSPDRYLPCSVLPSVHLSACGYFLLHLPVFCHVHSPFLLLNQQLPRGRYNSNLLREELSENYHLCSLCLWRHRF